MTLKQRQFGKLLVCVTCMITSSSKAQEWSLSTENKGSQCPLSNWVLSPTSHSHIRAVWFSDRPTYWALSSLLYYLAGGAKGHMAHTICLCLCVHCVSPNQTITRTERDQAKAGRKVYHKIYKKLVLFQEAE